MNKHHTIQCPACGAHVGDPCHDKGDPFPLLESHSARKQEAERRRVLRVAGQSFRKRHG